MRHSIPERVISVLCVTACAIFICVLASKASAQTRQGTSTVKVGTIKDYPGTGLMTGCGNLYFFRAGTPMTDADYVFLARGDGSSAWMNLNGRDLRLRQIKKAKPADQKPRGYNYRYGKMQITVVFEGSTPKDAAGENEPMYKMKIILRKGRAVRVVQAVGNSDC